MPDEEDITARIGRLVERVLEVHPLEPEANLIELGATSMEMASIANAMHAELGFRPNFQDMYRRPTVAALAGLYARRQGQSWEEGEV